MFAVGVMVGSFLGFLIAVLLSYCAIDEAWERGFQGGKRVAKIAGHIIARNNDLDELMVEYDGDMARYRRVTDEYRVS